MILNWSPLDKMEIIGVIMKRRLRKFPVCYIRLIKSESVASVTNSFRFCICWTCGIPIIILLKLRFILTSFSLKKCVLFWTGLFKVTGPRDDDQSDLVDNLPCWAGCWMPLGRLMADFLVDLRYAVTIEKNTLQLQKSAWEGSGVPFLLWQQLTTRSTTKLIVYGIH